MAVGRLLRSNAGAALAIAAAAFALAALAREAGLFERSDLALHDRLVRTAVPALEDDRFVLVLESEADLRRWKHPLSDELFAQILERLLEAGPAAIAIDKYRDAPVEPGSGRLAQLLRSADRIYWVRKFGNKPGEDVPAPAALDPRFGGCGDVVDDRDGMVRRGLLYVDDGQRVCYSLAFQVARHMASPRGLEFAIPKDDPDRFDLGKAHVRAIEPASGPYANVDAAGFQVALPSAAAARFTVVSLSDVLDGKAPASAFRGKAVLLGSSAESLGDYFNVPSTAAEGYSKVTGVSIHAASAAYLLGAAEGRVVAMNLAPRWTALALAALLALAAGAIACARRSLAVTLAGMAASVALLVIAAIVLARSGVFIASSAAAFAGAVAFVAGVVRSEWLERQERAELMSLFGRHVSHEVADDLWRRRGEFLTHGAVKPRQIVATILFLDIRGFTTVSEKLDADRLVVWLNRGLTVMIEEIMRHRGVVTRFAGDAVMAVFGSPVARKHEAEMVFDAIRAIDAGLGIGPALDRLNAALAADGLPAIRVRVGINTGTVTQCSVGASDRTEFTVLGDAVNIASRLESYTMDDEGETARVLIGDETFRFAEGSYAVRLVGSIQLKGKEQPVTVRQVLSKRSQGGG